MQRTREGWFKKVTGLFERAAIDDTVWTELEEMLISADVGMSTTEKLIKRVKERVAKEKARDGSQVRVILRDEIAALLSCAVPQAPITAPPRVVLVVGINGGGKTTSIGKLAYRFRQEGRSILLVAADTFRAAAIDQLKRWGEKVGAEVIAHQPGADPGAVVYDAMQAARNRHVDEVIIDTAGRLHTKFNLMEELKKVKRVITRIEPAAPHEVLLVLDASTGQNGLAQAKYFAEAVGVTGIVLAKLDGTAKGGIVLAICGELKIPIKFVGVGEKVEDIAPFSAADFVAALVNQEGA